MLRLEYIFSVIYHTSTFDTCTMDGEFIRFTYTNFYMPIDFKETPTPRTDIIKKAVENKKHIFKDSDYTISKDLNKNTAFNKPIIVRSSLGRYNPLPKRNEQNTYQFDLTTIKDVYVNVYGYLYNIYIPITQINDVCRYIMNPQIMFRYIDELVGVRDHVMKSLVGSKIVYKNNPDNSAMGGQFLLKLYFGGCHNSQEYLLKEELQKRGNKLYGSKIKPYTAFLESMGADSLGVMSIRVKDLEQVVGNSYDMYNVYYEDIVFESSDSFVFSKEFINKEIYSFISDIKKKIGELKLESVFSIKNIKERFQTDSRWGFKSFKNHILNTILGKLKYINLYKREFNDKFLLYSESYDDKDKASFGIDILKFQYKLRLFIKNFWHNVVKPVCNTIENLEFRELLFYTVARQQLKAVVDIETTKKFESTMKIISIHISIYDCGAHNTLLKYVSFVWISPQQRLKDKLYDIHFISKVCADYVKSVIDLNIIPYQNYNIYEYDSEFDLLVGYTDYIRANYLKILVSWNGHAFDIPVINSRLENLGIIPKRKSTNNHMCSSFELNFTYRKEKVDIKYRKSGKKSSTKIAKDRYIQNNHCFTDNDYDGGGGDGDDDDDNLIHHENSTNVNRFRLIENLIGTNIAFHDMIYETGSPNKIKLDVAAKKILGLRKLTHSDVEYNNLTETWERGDLTTFIAYNFMDTLICALIDIIPKKTAYHLATQKYIKLNFREIIGRETVRKVSALRYIFGHKENFISDDIDYVDSTIMYDPNYKYSSRDFHKLELPAGRTVNKNMGVYDNFTIPCFDYSSQYPSIISSRNICTSSQVTKSFIDSNNLIKDKDYTEILLKNACPLFRHSCVNTSCPKSSKCKFSLKYNEVKRNVYFVTKKRMISIGSYVADQLTKKRFIIKNKMKNFDKNSIEFETLEIENRSIKCLNNSNYGYLCLLNPIVGQTITHLGREQTELVAKDLLENSMKVINSDTDSVMCLYNSIPLGNKPLTALSNALFPNIQHKPSIDEIFKKLIAVQMNYANRITEDKLYQPCKLEFEKMFLSQQIDKKKNYYGPAIDPKNQFYIHSTGLIGNRSNASLFKKFLQLTLCRLISHRDIDGFIMLSHHAIDIMVTQIRAREISQFHVDTICDRILMNDQINFDEYSKDHKFAIVINKGSKRYKRNVSMKKMKALVEDSKRARTELSQHKVEKKEIRNITNYCYSSDIIDENYICSVEKIGDMETQCTPAIKHAERVCKRNGDRDFDNVKYNIKMIRSAETQVCNIIIDKLETLLQSPITYETDRLIENLEKNRIGLRKYDNETIAQRKKHDRSLAKSNMFTRLSITRMPDKYIAPATDRTNISQKHQIGLFYLKKHTEDIRRSLIKERNCEFKKSYYDMPKMYSNIENVNAIIKQLTALCDDFDQKNENHLPIYFYDEEYCVTSFSEQWTVHSVFDIWKMYLNLPKQSRYRYLFIRVIDKNMPLEFNISDTLPPNSKNCIFFYSNMNSLIKKNSVDLNKPGTVCVLDMREDYCLQTRSTPFVLLNSNCTQRFLMNNDSFCNNRPNRFSFQIETQSFKTLLKHTSKSLGFKPIPNSSQILVSLDYDRKNCVTYNVTYIRDDDNVVSRWEFEDEDFKWITISDFYRDVWFDKQKTRMDCYKPESYNIMFYTDVKKMVFSPSNSMETYSCFYETNITRSELRIHSLGLKNYTTPLKRQGTKRKLFNAINSNLTIYDFFNKRLRDDYKD
uniref:DNA-directed DNA polymerase n=1 Tax=Malaco herpesvirus 2 TaxID=3031798 RepID=A0AA48P7K9_9VIRU|nr:TPA_asm: DNA polymerase B [Malaco herpesvirus 2]